MDTLDSLSNEQLLARLPLLCSEERRATAEVIVYLAEVERRKLYLQEACSSLFAFCVERLGYSEQAALKRMRVARLYLELPQILDELKSGALHLTGLFLLSGHLTEDNVESLLAEARGKTRRELELVIARWFPRPDVLASITPLGAESTRPGIGAIATGHAKNEAPADGVTYPETSDCFDGAEIASDVTYSGTSDCLGGAGTASDVTYPGTSDCLDGGGIASNVTYPETSDCFDGARIASDATYPETSESRGSGRRQHGAQARVQPLSAQSYRIEFTASAELHAKLERAQNLLSHAVEPGNLGELFERALDELIAKGTKRRQGVVSEKPRKPRPLKERSRHVPVSVAREVWERDESQCTFVDAHGRRCSEKRYVTLEHVDPHARGGPPTAENLCLLCKPHNLDAARREFGEEHIRRKQREREAYSKAGKALVALGFRRQQVNAALDTLRERRTEPEVEALLRQAVALLYPVKQVSPHSADAEKPAELRAHAQLRRAPAQETIAP